MERINCIYLVPEEHPGGGKQDSVYRCLAGKVRLCSHDLEQDWACAGCEIPALLNNEHCLYLEPGKRFFNGGESVVILMCALKEKVLPNLSPCRDCTNYIRAAPNR